MPFTRRKFLAASAVLPGLALVPRAPARPAPFAQAQFCLNTSTIRGFNLGIEEEVDVAANAGYDAIEPWISSLREYRDAGRSLPDLRKRLEDRGLTVESAIGFAPWIVDDDAQRAKGLEEARRDMDLLAQVGGKRLAAPPSGATREPGLDLFKAAARYRALLEIGDEIGVVPRSRSGASLLTSPVWVNPCSWPWKAATPRPACWPTSTMCIEAGPTTRVSACSVRIACRCCT